MKILSLLNLLAKLPRTNRLFIRARNYGLNELTHLKPVYIVEDTMSNGNNVDNYGKYRYATGSDKEKEIGFELIFEDKKNV